MPRVSHQIPTSSIQNDDMYDLPAGIGGRMSYFPGPADISTICAPYWKANDRAIQLQKTHRRITNFAL